MSSYILCVVRNKDDLNMEDVRLDKEWVEINEG